MPDGAEYSSPSLAFRSNAIIARVLRAFLAERINPRMGRTPFSLVLQSHLARYARWLCPPGALWAQPFTQAFSAFVRPHYQSGYTPRPLPLS